MTANSFSTAIQEQPAVLLPERSDKRVANEGRPAGPQPFSPNWPRYMNRILIIDDEPEVRGIIGAALRSTGAEILEADDAQTGLQLTRAQRPDLVICDLHLGGRSGLDVLSQMRQNPATATIALILITGSDATTVRRQSMNLGADDFLHKPFTVQELLAAVNARLRKQHLLRAESERTTQRLRRLLEATDDLVVIMEPDAHVVQYLNRAARQLAGLLQPEQGRLISLGNLLSPDALDDFYRDVLPAAMRDGIWRGESHWLGRNGQEVLVREELLVHRMSDGSVDCLSLVARDVTEEARAADMLRTLSRAIEQTPVSILITDPQGRIEYVNPCFEKLTGYTAEEAIGKTPEFLKSSEPPGDDYQSFWETIRAGHEWNGEMRTRKKNGETAWEQESVSPVRDAQGRITHFISVKQDITERKLAETERNRTELQLRQAQKLQAIGHLAAGIAHEINTPVQFIGDNTRFLGESFGQLTVLLGKVSQILEPGATDSIKSQLVTECRDLWVSADVDYIRSEVPVALRQTLEGVARIGKIVLAMKDFSHPGSTEKAFVDINNLIESTLTICRNEWKYVADLVTQFDAGLTAVPCLPGEFNQVILNLVVNAAHAISDALGPARDSKGMLTITTCRNGVWAEVRISDTGTGISESVRPHIFEPFFTTKEVGRGTGQGLAMAHSVIVDKHSGTLHFETEMGKGTTFIIRLPLLAPHSNEGPALTRAIKPTADSDSHAVEKT